MELNEKTEDDETTEVMEFVVEVQPDDEVVEFVVQSQPDEYNEDTEYHPHSPEICMIDRYTIRTFVILN